MIRIYCLNTKTSMEFPEGTSLLEMIDRFDFDRPYPILVARVNNVIQGLKYRAYNSRDVEFLDYTAYAGRSIYCRSLCFLASKAAGDVFPGCEIKMRRPISKGFFCSIRKEQPLTEEDIEKIRSRMREIVDQGLSFRRVQARTEDAIKLFSSLGQTDKVRLLQTTDHLYTDYHELGGTPDFYYDALLPDASYLKVWELVKYKEGMLLRVPNRHEPDTLAPFVAQPKTFEVFQESVNWNMIMGLENVGDVNQACLNGGAPDLIKISEALQEKKIVKMAEEIDRRFRQGNLKIVLITGPSSSGKSTICSRLSTQIKACGLHPVSLSTDDYFVNRVDTPRLPDGMYDFDNFETVDHRMMERDLARMAAGEEVEVPEYNFVTGEREYNGKKIRLDSHSVLLVEGIHALNPALTAAIPEEKKFKIFINTIVSISLDDHNCIPTSDNRLLRRILRDYKKGAYTARSSIANWPNVRRAEVKWIYPFQESADVLFNSAYLVEFAVLRPYAEQVLRTVPRNCREYAEASRLLKFLSYFVPVDSADIPATSLLKEFVG